MKKIIMAFMLFASVKAISQTKSIQPIVIGKDTLSLLVVNEKYTIDSKKKVFVVAYLITNKDNQSVLRNKVIIPYVGKLIDGDELVIAVANQLPGVKLK